MTKTMTVLKGSSINADNLTIKVEQGTEILFEKTYHYGYDVSWDKGFASKEKPLREDLIKEKAKEYGIAIEDIQYGEGANLFKEIMKKGGRI